MEGRFKSGTDVTVNVTLPAAAGVLVPRVTHHGQAPGPGPRRPGRWPGGATLLSVPTLEHGDTGAVEFCGHIRVYWFSENRKFAFGALAWFQGLRCSLITLYW